MNHLKPSPLFPHKNPKSFQYKKFMCRRQFEIIFKSKFSSVDNEHHQITDILDAVNNHPKDVMEPGDFLCFDESMVKALHKNLKGKMKIIEKPQPIGN